MKQDIITDQNKEKLIRSLSNYIIMLISTSAFFITPIMLILLKNAPSEESSTFFAFFYYGLYSTIIIFLTTILMGILNINNLHALSIMTHIDHSTQEKVLKLYGLTRQFYRIGIYFFALLFPARIAANAAIVLHWHYTFLITYSIVLCAIIVLKTVITKFVLTNNSPNEFWHE